MASAEPECPLWVEPLSDDERLRTDERVRVNLLRHAERYAVSYQNCFALQTDITDTMRGILLSWLRDVCAERQLADDTFTLACSLVDRHSALVDLHRSYYQLVGGACLLVASKLRDPTPIETPEIVLYTERTVTREQLFEYEQLLVRSLQFDLESVTAWDLVCYVIRLFSIPGLDDDLDENYRLTLRDAAKQFIYAVICEKICLNFSPMVVAAAAVAYALASTSLGIDESTMATIRDVFACEACELLRVEATEAKECLRQVAELQRNAASSNSVLRDLVAIDSLLTPQSKVKNSKNHSDSGVSSSYSSPLLSNSADEARRRSFDGHPRSHSSPFVESHSRGVTLVDVPIFEDFQPTQCDQSPSKHVSVSLAMSSGYVTLVDIAEDKENTQESADCALLL